jgi:hypothetical protein
MSNHYSPTADNQSRARQQAIPTAHYIGLDLGQTRDPSALAVMERSEISMGVSPVTFRAARSAPLFLPPSGAHASWP